MTQPGREHTPVPLGPFSGGLNQLEDPRIIGDDQLAVCQNMDIGRSGELILRNGLREQTSTTQVIKFIGAATKSDNTSRLYEFAAGDGFVYYNDSPLTVSAYIFLTVQAGQTEKTVQYNNNVYVIPKGVQFGTATAGVGFYQNLTSNAITSVASMPRGTGSLIFKDRLFIFGPVDRTNTATQRIYYSAATDPTNWPAANFFDVNPGDGEGVTAMIAIQDTLIIFKRHSTYALFYDTDPGLGVLRRVNTQIGATGPDAVAQFENGIFIIDEKAVYRIQNLLFTDIGKNINLRVRRVTQTFAYNTLDQAFVFGNRIIFTVYTGRGGGADYEYYIYNTEIDAWSQYTFTFQPRRFFRIINTSSFEDYLATNETINFSIFSPFRTDNAALGDGASAITPMLVKTKMFNLDHTSSFKRLFWWGMDITASRVVNMTAIADGVASAVAAVTGSGAVQFYKAFNPARFRYMQFQVDSATAGQRLTIFPGIAHVGIKPSGMNVQANT